MHRTFGSTGSVFRAVLAVVACASQALATSTLGLEAPQPSAEAVAARVSQSIHAHWDAFMGAAHEHGTTYEIIDLVLPLEEFESVATYGSIGEYGFAAGYAGLGVVEVGGQLYGAHWLAKGARRVFVRAVARDVEEVFVTRVSGAAGKKGLIEYSAGPIAPGSGAASVAAKGVGSRNAYSVAFRTKLPSSAYPGRSRAYHFQQANRQLIEAMDANPDLAARIEAMIPNIRQQLVHPRSFSRQPPTGWTWHHHADTGVMELVPRVQHEAAGSIQDLLHPGGEGGMSIWGR